VTRALRVRGVCGLKGFCKKKDMSAMAAAEKEEQREIFYCIMAAYVKNKLVEEDLEEDFWKIWLGKGAMIVTRDWLDIINVYAAMLKCCGLSMHIFVDPVLRGDDAKHYLSYAYSRFLAPEVKPNEMYERCVSVMATLLQNVSTNPIFSISEGSDESSVAKLVAKLEKL
jgi:hypothetical protein